MKLISIPEYFKAYINKDIDLTVTPKICCPFHEETLPSFSYSIEKEIWRCFGACKVGGDVIVLHQVNFNLKNRADAKISLYKLLGLAEESKLQKPTTPLVPEQILEKNVAYANALRAATTINDWLELDYIMSQSPVDVSVLEMFANSISGG
jgi:DNA primase